MDRDKETTKQKLLQAVGEIIEDKGLEYLGVNIVAQKAGVSKMLIYRYFGCLDDLIGHYIMQHDYWTNIPDYIPPKTELNQFIKELFGNQIDRLRNDKLLIRLYRWELSVDNSIVRSIRKQREENGLKLIKYVTEISEIPYEQVQLLATLISSSITYLVMFSHTGIFYNGYDLSKDEGWRKLQDGINQLIDKWI